jgi:hypothetical protein
VGAAAWQQGVAGGPGTASPDGAELPILPLDGAQRPEAGASTADGGGDGWQGRGPGAAAGRPMSLGDTLPIVSPGSRRATGGTGQAQPTPSNAQPTPTNTTPSQPTAPSNAAHPQPTPITTTHSQPTPSNASHAQPAPSGAAHAQPAPTDTAQAQPTPGNAAPAQPAPTDTAQAQPTPGNAAPAQPAPTDPAHAQPTPSSTPQAQPAISSGGEAAATGDAAREGRSGEAGTAGERRPQHLGDGTGPDADEARHEADAAPRVGAHAAPYMDAHGVLHNLKPIGRLAVSGPDTAPRQADSEFGSLWFGAKEEGPDGTPAHRDGDDPVVVDLDVTGLSGGAEPRTEKAEEAPKAPEEKARPELTAADLQAIRWRLDGGTLREVVDDKDALLELGEKLDEPLADEADNVAKAGLLSVRAEVYRLLGELGMAAAASRLALAHAESARDTQSMVIAQAELAHVLRLRGDFGEADRLFVKAASARVPAPLRSVVHENAGRCCFDQGRYMEALDHFARAVRLGRSDDTELAERIGVCLEAVYIHVLRDGWGPYPREVALEEVTAEQPTL